MAKRPKFKYIDPQKKTKTMSIAKLNSTRSGWKDTAWHRRTNTIKIYS